MEVRDFVTYFEIEDSVPDIVDKETGEIIAGLRRYGKSKEHRPNPIAQMGMFMDFAMYLKHRRAENIKRAKKLVDKKQTKSRQSQQDTRHYVTTMR